MMELQRMFEDDVTCVYDDVTYTTVWWWNCSECLKPRTLTLSARKRMSQKLPFPRRISLLPLLAVCAGPCARRSVCVCVLCVLSVCVCVLRVCCVGLDICACHCVSRTLVLRVLV